MGHHLVASSPLPILNTMMRKTEVRQRELEDKEPNPQLAVLNNNNTKDAACVAIELYKAKRTVWSL